MSRGLLLYILSLLLLTACGGEKKKRSAKQAFTDPLPDTVSFSQHIAPIIYQNCTPCHRPASAGPFNLISYRDVAKRKKMVAK
ncbi:MAG: hypothetical protein AAGM67_14340, partial [Bacteroidota bacterium]